MAKRKRPSPPSARNRSPQEASGRAEETENSIYKYVQTIKNAELLTDARFSRCSRNCSPKPRPTTSATSSGTRTTATRRAGQARRGDLRSGRDQHVPRHDRCGLRRIRRSCSPSRTAGARQPGRNPVRGRPGPFAPQSRQPVANDRQAGRALADYESALRLRGRWLRRSQRGRVPERPVRTLNNIGNLHYQSSRPAKALAAFDQAIQVQQSLAAAQPANVKYQMQLAALQMNRGIFFSTRQHDEALDALHKARAIQEPDQNNPKNTEAHVRLAGCLQNLGNLHSELEHPAEALASYERAVQICEHVALANPTIDEYQSNWAGNLSNLGLEYGSAGRNGRSTGELRKGHRHSGALVR